ncbi:methyl-accepting chemotaxis protein [Aquabacterium sp.]|uniref:methyl-accepting chemotaxis protein n=1 Tax=Aquabacterium sp. TaxID=1872578 RepID=UPI0025C3CA49|nr:methyl-accepting chemotaxis protein [Aquabacterium sp.]
MSLQRQLSLSTRLALGFGIATLLCAACAAIGIVQLDEQARRLDTLAHNRIDKINQLAELKGNFAEAARATRDYLFDPDGPARQNELATLRNLKARNDELLAQMDKSMKLPRSRELLDAVTKARKDYIATSNKIMELAGSNRVIEARFLLYGEYRNEQRSLFQSVDQLVSYQHDLAVHSAEEGQAQAEEARFALISFATLALLASVGVGFALARSVSRALGAEPWEVSDVVSRVASGDLSSPIRLRNGDQASTMAAVKRMQFALQKTVGQVMSSAESVAGASSQIAQGNNDLSQRTQEQAAALQQTAAAMETMHRTVRGNTATADEANQLAGEASNLAGRGGQVIGEFVQTIQAMSHNANRIGEITSLIDALAFQTNILALNAAVEAARAGEQGRGFAVVAGEVRSLAQRSAEAAKQITDVIAASTAQVEQSSVQVMKAQVMFDEISSAVASLRSKVSDIHLATKAQYGDISDVGLAVNQLDMATQQNATLVEESAAAADSLKHQAGRLLESVALFRLDGGLAQSRLS